MSIQRVFLEPTHRTAIVAATIAVQPAISSVMRATEICSAIEALVVALGHSAPLVFAQ